MRFISREWQPTTITHTLWAWRASMSRIETNTSQISLLMTYWTRIKLRTDFKLRDGNGQEIFFIADECLQKQKFFARHLLRDIPVCHLDAFGGLIMRILRRKPSFFLPSGLCCALILFSSNPGYLRSPVGWLTHASSIQSCFRDCRERLDSWSCSGERLRVESAWIICGKKGSL